MARSKPGNWTRRSILRTIPAAFASSLFPPQLSSLAAPGKTTAPPFSRFVDVAQSAGLTQTMVYGGTDHIEYIVELNGGGCAFFDYDNDGWMDIFVANGHVNPQVDGHAFGVTYAERNFLFHNLGGRFSEVGREAGEALRRAGVHRGLAVGDFQNKGFLDAIVTQLDGSPILLRNKTLKKASESHWIAIRTVGTNSNRDGFGARIEVEAGGRTQVQEVRANSSFLSASDPRTHFGLGSATRVDKITVRWPSGLVDTLRDQAVDRFLVVKERAGVMR